MARATIVLRVLIASPFKVSEERDIIRNVIHEWNAVHSRTQQVVLEPVRWETRCYPASTERPQGIIDKQIVADTDAVIGIFGHWYPHGRGSVGNHSGDRRVSKAWQAHLAVLFQRTRSTRCGP